MIFHGEPVMIYQQSRIRKDDGRQLRRQGDGLYLETLATGSVLEIKTEHHQYRLVKDGDTHVRISGHPTFCPEPVEMVLEGSVGKRHPLSTKPGFIGCGMHLVLKHPRFDLITTSRIREICKC